MKTIHYSAVIIPPDRQRKEFSAEHLRNLADDFTSGYGILHPIVLRNDGLTLVVGECRLRALAICAAEGKPIQHAGQTLPIGHIPYSALADLPEVDLVAAELHENTRRKNLTLMEEAKAVARYQALRRAEFPAITDKQLMQELHPVDTPSSTTEAIRDMTLIAKHADMPEVANAKSKGEALRAIRRTHNTDLTNTLGKLISSNYIGSHKNLLGDARDVLATLPSGTYACICTDPPYGVGADKFSSVQEQDHKYADDFTYFKDLLSTVAPELFRVASDQAHLYLFCDPRHWHILRDIFAEVGWNVWNRPIIWHKAVGPANGLGIAPRPEHAPRNSYDCVLFANKGDRKVNSIQPDVISNCPRTTVSGHPAEKPASVYINLLERSCQPGDQVLDPFAGGGPIFPAVIFLHLHATGINRDEADHNLAASRLNEHTFKGDL